MELMDSPSQIESTRAHCFDLAAAAFSTNKLDLERFESFAGEIAAATTITTLQEIQGRLPEVPTPPLVEPQLIRAEHSNIKKTGRWLESSQLCISGKSSNITLDFTDYRGERGLRIDLELECRSMNIRLIVPQDIEVIERIEANRMSVLRNRRRPSDADNAIVITGSISSTHIKVKRKKRK